MKSALKTLLPTFALLVFVVNTKAQTVLYQQNFENTENLFHSYVLYEGDHGIPASTDLSALADSAWIVRKVASLNTHAAIGTSDYTPDATANDWFITPAIQLGKGSKLSFRAAAAMASPADQYTVYISTSQQDVNSCMFNEPLATFQGEQAGEWTDRTINLAAAGYASQQVYLGFRLHTQNGGNNLFIDDITVLDDSAASLVSLTFNVNLADWIREGKFLPSLDSIDIVGNFNNWIEAEYMLDSLPTNDSIYTITIPGFTLGQHLEFKFRIDCSWADTLVEFPYGLPNRVWDIEEGKYTYSCYYNNEGKTYGIRESQAIMSSVIIYPNPFVDELQMVVPNQVKKVGFTSLKGSKINEWRTCGRNSLNINLQDISPGTYMLLFYSQNGFIGSRKVIKM